MYQALYRKWRPKTFTEVIGQSHITDTLRRQVEEGRTAHAYLFTGTRGTGKTTCARILAKAINCLHPVAGEPCNECEACRGIDEGTLLDITELDAASNNGVDHVRALREEAVYTPAVLKKRVYIIDEVHMLSTPAFNALLKILEEPPEHLVFILATTELHKVPATILSRCQRFSFKRILPRDMEKHLLHVAAAEQIDLQPDGAEILARMANGALRDALSLLDQCRAAEGTLDSRAVLEVLGLAGSVQTVQLMQRILERDAGSALMQLGELYGGGKDLTALLGELSDLTRDMMILKTAGKDGADLLTGVYERKTLTELGKDVSMARFLYLTQTLQAACAAISDSFYPRTEAELCIMKLCDEGLSGDLAALTARMDRLEQQLRDGVTAAPTKPARRAAPAPVQRETPPPTPIDEPPLPEEPPLPDEPPLSDEPNGRERVFDIPDELPEQSARPVRRPAAARPAPQQSASAVSSDTGVWAALLDQYKGRLPVQHRVFLNMAQGSLRGDCLTVYCKNEFVRDSLNHNTVLAVLREVTSAAQGTPIRVELAVGDVAAKPAAGARRAAPARKTAPAPAAKPAAPVQEQAAPAQQAPSEPPPWEESAPQTADRLSELARSGAQLDNFKIK